MKKRKINASPYFLIIYLRRKNTENHMKILVITTELQQLDHVITFFSFNLNVFINNNEYSKECDEAV